MACVYALFSTDRPSDIRYIGISKYDTADKRVARHISTSTTGAERVRDLPIYRWVRKAISEGHSIGYVILESNLSWDESCVLEMEHIREYRESGADLLNMTDGGEGFLGGKHSEESKEKIRAYWTPEKRAAQRDRTFSRGAYVFTEEDLKKMSSSAKTRHDRYRSDGVVWGVDVGPKDNTPKHIKDRIFLEKKSGKSFQKIADGLNSDGLASARGGKWYATSVKNIYDRQLYKPDV